MQWLRRMGKGPIFCWEKRWQMHAIQRARRGKKGETPPFSLARRGKDLLTGGSRYHARAGEKRVRRESGREAKGSREQLKLKLREWGGGKRGEDELFFLGGKEGEMVKGAQADIPYRRKRGKKRGEENDGLNTFREGKRRKVYYRSRPELAGPQEKGKKKELAHPALKPVFARGGRGTEASTVVQGLRLSAPKREKKKGKKKGKKKKK